MINKIINSDCLSGLKQLPDGSVNCCVTSPPYFGLRDYGTTGQLGLEPNPKDYVSKLVEIFREVKRVLRDDGTVWLNIGDSYSHGGCGSRDNTRWPKQSRNDHLPVHAKKNTGVKPKELLGIPWRVAFALQEDGWYLRQDIIWNKPNPMPESVTDRCSKCHEYIFLLSKSSKYYFDNKSIKEPIAASTIGRGKVDFGGAKGRAYKAGIKETDPNFRNGSEQRGRTFDYEKSCAEGRNKRSVWTVPVYPYKESHFATFPPELIRPCIRAGCPGGGVVLDPFMGAGTTALVALQERRTYVGFELNPEYIKIIEKRLKIVEVKLF